MGGGPLRQLLPTHREAYLYEAGRRDPGRRGAEDPRLGGLLRIPAPRHGDRGRKRIGTPKTKGRRGRRRSAQRPRSVLPLSLPPHTRIISYGADRGIWTP